MVLFAFGVNGSIIPLVRKLWGRIKSMNRINILATMGFTGIAIAFTLLGVSDKPTIKPWAIILGIISLLMIAISFIISGQEDKNDKSDKETIISELKKANNNFSGLDENIRGLVNELRQDRDEQNKQSQP